MAHVYDDTTGGRKMKSPSFAEVKFPKKLYLLIALAYIGVNAERFTKVTLKTLAEHVDKSTQSVSRLLRELAEEGFIEHSSSTTGTYVKFTEKSLVVLRNAYEALRRVFEPSKRFIELRGVVFTGFGEGKFYMSLEGYRSQIREKLGFDPYPGTLNVRLHPQYIKYRLMLELLPGITIEGFSNGKRTYGRVKAFRASLQGVSGAVLLIERSSYGPDVVEFISPVKVRDLLKLKDGDEVVILVEV